MNGLKFYSTFLILFLIIIACQSENETANQHLNQIEVPSSTLGLKIDSLMLAYVANKKFNGNLLVMKGDSVLYTRSFGMADRAFDIENSATTKFLIGSITKPFTAMGILILVDKKRISLTDRLSDFFPNFPHAEKVSVKQLLMHTAGVKDYHANKNWVAAGQVDISPIETIKSLGENPYDFEPGTQFRYSNSGYILLGLIIEQVSGLSFEKFIQKEILNPLNLKHTGIADNETIVSNLAKGYISDLKTVKQAPYINYRQPFSSGNMYSTTSDLYSYTKAVMESRLIPKELTQEIFKVSDQYGYGWGIRFFDELKAYGHFGGMNGFVGSINYIPKDQYFICFLTNDDNTPKYAIVANLVDLIKGKSVELPIKKTLVDLNESMVKKTEGNYLIKPGDTLKVFEHEGNLYLQETGQLKHEMFPIGQAVFTFTLLEFNVIFKHLENKCYQALELKGKINLAAKRI